MTTGRINQVAIRRPPGGAFAGTHPGSDAHRPEAEGMKIERGWGVETPDRLNRGGAPPGIPAILLPPLSSPGTVRRRARAPLDGGTGLRHATLG
jgi:hypothetical protein